MKRSLEKSLMTKYIEEIEGDHSLKSPIRKLDFLLRTYIGKSERVEDLRIGLCSHQAILERERDTKGRNPEHFCRKCGINLNTVGIGRCNDHLVLRNPFCRGPICMQCIDDGGDVFYQAFSRGVEEYGKRKSGQARP